MTSRAPAAWCSPSTFWVMIPVSWPRRMQFGHGLVAAAFGAAAAMARQPRWLRAQYRCRAAALLPMNVWYVIGCAFRARPVGPR